MYLKGRKLSLLLAFHNHQPVGNFEHVFLEATEKCYLPFLKTAIKYPTVKFSLHYTGPLFEWFEKNKPEIFEMLKILCNRRQVEFLGGGFYEPMLAVIPERDAAGQILMMRRFLKDKFDVEPNGMWLAERVWDPDLPRVLSMNGVKFSLLDDNCFFLVGVNEKPVTGYYSTEKAGHKIALFPIDKGLRYKIPFDSPENILEYLREIYEKHENSTCVTYGDDGEKFGIWPGTHKLSYEEGWLDRFFTLFSEERDWLETTTFSEYMESHNARGRIYLPSASYQEMMEWSGGIWQNFLRKYDESNLIHKKMIYVSEKIAEVEKRVPGGKLKDAKKALFRGQCNCAYWHGLFGGLYLNYLRHALFENLIRAEKIADSFLKDRTAADCEFLDYDSDFAEEIILSSKKIGVLIKPSAGGNILELDYKPLEFNLTNVITRREESYHKRLKLYKTPYQQESAGKIKTIHELHLSKEDGLNRFLVYDRYPRNSFITRLLHPETGIEAFESQTFEEYGNFSRGNYNYQKECQPPVGGSCGIILRRAENISPGGRCNHVELVKTIAIREGGEALSLSAVLESKEPLNFDFLMTIEFNFTLLAGNDPSRFYRIKGMELAPEEKMMNSRGLFKGVNQVMFEDHWQFLRVTLEADEPLDFWRYPIETVSMSEGGSERTYQGFCLTAVKRIRAGDGTRHVLNLSLIFDNFGAEKW